MSVCVSVIIIYLFPKGFCNIPSNIISVLQFLIPTKQRQAFNLQLSNVTSVSHHITDHCLLSIPHMKIGSTKCQIKFIAEELL